MSWFSRGSLQNGRAHFAMIARQSGRERLTPLDFGGERQRRLDERFANIAAHAHAPRQIFASRLIRRRLLHRLRIAMYGIFSVAVRELLWTDTDRALWRRVGRLELLRRFQIAHHIYFEAFVQVFFLVLLLLAHCYIYGFDLVHVQYGLWRGIEWFRTLIIRWAWGGCFNFNLTYFYLNQLNQLTTKLFSKWVIGHVVLIQVCFC